MNEQEELIEKFEKSHPCYFDSDYKKLLTKEPVERVRKKLAECEEWIAFGGVGRISA